MDIITLSVNTTKVHKTVIKYDRITRTQIERYTNNTHSMESHGILQPVNKNLW